LLLNTTQSTIQKKDKFPNKNIFLKETCETAIETMKNSPDSSGMVADWVGADPCVCPQRRQATIRTDSRTKWNDEALNLSLLKKKIEIRN